MKGGMGGQRKLEKNAEKENSFFLDHHLVHVTNAMGRAGLFMNMTQQLIRSTFNSSLQFHSYDLRLELECYIVRISS